MRRPRLRGDPPTRWSAQRDHRRKVAQTTGRLLVVVGPDGSLDLPDAPDTRRAVRHAWGLADHPRLVGLPTLLGALSAAEWARRGLRVPGLHGRLRPAYGVFSPTRHAYVRLLDELDGIEGTTVLDVGCGTGVLGLVLLQRGASTATGIDTDPRAVRCATSNARRLGLTKRYQAAEGDLFAGHSADLVVFNPPWIPGQPRTRLDRAIFDPEGSTLDRWLQQLRDHLEPRGRGVLLASDLAERLGLAPPIAQRIEAAGLDVVHHAARPPGHQIDGSDPFAPQRRAETIGLWVVA